jgi:hypothetical protein
MISEVKVMTKGFNIPSQNPSAVATFARSLKLSYIYLIGITFLFAKSAWISNV